MEFTKDQIKIIDSIFKLSVPTRASLSETTGFSIIKITELLNELEKMGVIKKEGKQQSGTGRPSIIYTLTADVFYTLGIALEAEYFYIAITDCEKKLVFSKKFSLEIPAETDIPAYLVETIGTCINKIVSEYTAENKTISAACMALTGMVDSKRGTWLSGPHHGILKPVKIAEMLENFTHLPFFIDDRARSVTFLEKNTGKGKDLDNFVLLYLGNGIGSGIFINGELYIGNHGTAGEIGHISVNNNSYRCSCGKIGCLESIISPTGIIRVINDRLKEGVISSMSQYLEEGATGITIELIKEAAESGDRLAINTLHEVGNFIGNACCTLIKLYNPQKILISGYSSILGNFFKESLEQKIVYELLPELLIDYETIYCDYNESDDAYGAGLRAFYRFLRKKSEESEK